MYTCTLITHENSSKILPILFLFFVVFLQAAGAEVIALEELVQTLGLELQWEPVSSRGVLFRDNTYFSFFPAIPYASINFQQIVPLDPINWDSTGRLFVPEDTVEQLERLFPPEDLSSSRNIATIFIDPGHGGKDPGAIGRHVLEGETHILQEKDIVLDISLRLYELLRQRFPDKRIVLSRSDDRYIELIDRYEMANALTAATDSNSAVLFVSIHANASINRNARGFEVWYLPPEFRRTLITENDFDGEQEVVPILNSMLEEEFTIQSIMLGRSILQGLNSNIGNRSENRGLKQEIFAVVRGARMPSVLVEAGFLTNQQEFQLLQQDSYLQEIAQGIYNGLNDFITNYEE